MKKYSVIGLMSGTSLDGLDIAHCYFFEEDEKWSFQLEKAVTIPYEKEWKEKLQQAADSSAIEIAQLDVDYGRYLGTLTKEFIAKHQITVQIIASHGHTIFHTPKTGLSLQIGCGANIAAICNVPVICDFRTLDVALGGEGAPLVPIGDKLLFSEYEYCLNLGGIANISYEENGKRLAFDICPANMALNYFANKAGLEYDENGKLAGQGVINAELLNDLNALDFYKHQSPKSLGREWFEKVFLPIAEKYELPIADKLSTICEHIGMKVGEALKKNTQENKETILVTGGGSFNRHLLQAIARHCTAAVHIPGNEIVNYKEALIFGFLGVLRFLNKINVLQSVTGANRDSSSGTIYWI